MYFIYNLIISVSFIFVVPYLLLKNFSNPAGRSAFKEKLGFISQAKKALLNTQPKIWVHAVSVGEISASRPLIELIQQKFPNYQLVISTTTLTGGAVAKRRISGAIFLYFPIDVLWVVSRVLNIVKPALILVAEGELWPNFFREAHKRNIPIILFNGRLSVRSYRSYRKAGVFFRQVMGCISSFCMQTEVAGQRIIALGADSSRVKVSGNAKFDALEKLEPEQSAKLTKEFRVSPQDLILVAGSTHPGEEKVVLDCFIRLSKEFSNLRLILCPRHLERLSKIERTINYLGLVFIRRTALSSKASAKIPGVIILDTLGELAKIYSLADVVFVGKSLLSKGGQNILEPINFGKPVIYGPFISNFQEIAELMEEEGVGFRIQNEEQLYEKIRLFLKDEELREDVKSKAEAIIKRYQGASEKTLDLIKTYL